MQRFSTSLAVMCTVLLCAGCMGRVSGQVYVDANGNGMMDYEESALDSKMVSITRDGKRIAQGCTEPDGTFGIKSRGKGVYCVSVDKTNACSLLDSDHPDAAKALKVAAADEDDDASSDTKPEPVATEPDLPVGPNCCRGTFAGSCDIEVKVDVDYAADVAEMPDRLPRKMKPGQVSTLGIAYPCACELQPLYLPDGLELAVEDLRGDVSFQPSLGRVDFGPRRGASADGSVETGTCVANISVRFKTGVEEAQCTTTLAPKATCPNTQIVNLPRIPFICEKQDVEP